MADGKVTESKVEDFAEELGKLLGNAQAKAEGWLGQRTQITKALEGIRDTASRLLADLGHAAERVVHPGAAHAAVAPGATVAPHKRGPGRPKGSGQKARRTMSPAARARISAAQKKRWAKVRAEKKR